MSLDYKNKLLKLASFYNVSGVTSKQIKNKRITISQIELLLKKNGIKLPFSFSNKKIHKKSNFKNFYLTGAASLIFVFIFSLSPILKNNYEHYLITSKEINNNSKMNLEKVLEGKEIKKEDKFDSAEIFEDILRDQELPTDTVRLNASTLNELFKETKYSLENVRKSKLVKPFYISLLPNEMKMIQSSQKRKNLFIQIILPLILEENNKVKIERKKLFRILNKNNNSPSEKSWIRKKIKQYGIKDKDLSTLKIRMDIIPVSLVIAQAAKETGWGTSRFALEGNALFGQWTWSGDGIKPLEVSSEKTHKVMKFKILQASVRAYQRNLNTHPSYKKFRMARAELRDNGEKLASLSLVNYLDKYAQTGQEYIKVLKQIIKQNSLTDFDDVRLLPTSRKLKNII